MNIVIRNVGDIPVKLYSIMPGTTTIPLYKSNGKYDNINWMQYKFNELKGKEISDIEKQKQLNEYILDVTKQIVINLRVGVIENKINTEINYR